MILASDIKLLKQIKSEYGLRFNRVEHKSCSTVMFPDVPQEKKFEYLNDLKSKFPKCKVHLGYNTNISIQFSN